jgi:hypothetical protein
MFRGIGGTMWETMIKQMIVTNGVKWVFLPVDRPASLDKASTCSGILNTPQIKRLSKYGIHTVEIPQIQVPFKVISSD